MILANILVHVNSRPRASARLALAVRIAERVGARLTGLFAEEAQAYVVGTVASWPSPHYTAALESARNAFSTVAAPLGARAMFMDVNRGSDHEIAHRFVAIARTFDLVVLGQTEEHAPALAKLPENVIVESGRPRSSCPMSEPIGMSAAARSSPGTVRAAPRGRSPTRCRCSRRIATGLWSRSAADQQRDEFAEILVSNLAAHKIGARYQHFVVDEISVMDTLLSAVSDHAADLLATGAFNSGAQSLFGHGGGTRHLLAHMTTPVLFSH